MKQSFLAILFTYTLNCFSQPMISFREVYNFNIGDIFQYRVETGTLPEGFMWTILSKELKDSNTISYSRNKLSYSSFWDNGILRFKFFTYIDTLKIGDLDSLVCNEFRRKYDGSSPDNEFNDTIIFSNFWNTRVYEYNHIYGPNLDKWYTTEIFGEGLGKMEYYIANPSNSYKIRYSLSYCKRNGVEYGSRENAYLLDVNSDVNVRESIIIRPNPVTTKLFISVPYKESSKVKILNCFGDTVTELELNSNETTLNLEDLIPGIYTLLFYSNGNTITRKFIKVEK